MKRMRLRCNGCGKIVSTAWLISKDDNPIIIRAWIECPECIEKEKQEEHTEDPDPAWHGPDINKPYKDFWG